MQRPFLLGQVFYDALGTVANIAYEFLYSTGNNPLMDGELCSLKVREASSSLRGLLLTVLKVTIS